MQIKGLIQLLGTISFPSERRHEATGSVKELNPVIASVCHSDGSVLVTAHSARLIKLSWCVGGMRFCGVAAQGKQGLTGRCLATPFFNHATFIANIASVSGEYLNSVIEFVTHQQVSCERLKTQASGVIEETELAPTTANRVEVFQMSAREELQPMVVEVGDDNLLVIIIVGDSKRMFELASRGASLPGCA